MFRVTVAAGDFLESGNGSYNFTLLDMRETVAFWLFYGTIDTPNPIAR